MPKSYSIMLQPANRITGVITYNLYLFLLLTALSSSPANAQDRNLTRVDLEERLNMEFARVPAGTFSGRLCPSCRNQTVVISQPFEMSAHEITQYQWETVMQTKPWQYQSKVEEGAFYPATYVSWNDVQVFLSRLNAVDNQYMYRLPSSAQWEHACRAGSRDIFSFGSDSTALKAHAWYEFNTIKQGRPYAHPVGRKHPNKWGIHDLHGNVAEWVSDYAISGAQIGTAGVITDPEINESNSTRRVARGSLFYQNAKLSGSESCFEFSPQTKDAGIGFRIIRTRLLQGTSLDE